MLEDLGLDLPELATDVGELDHPWIAELRRVAPTSPSGQKRILAIDHPLVYRLRRSSERGATWMDPDGVVWLCAVHHREEGSDDDAFAWFAELHQAGRLLPTDDDRLRDQAEATIRAFRRLRQDLFTLADRVREEPDTEFAVTLDGWLPSRAVLFQAGDVEEIWFALSVRADDGSYVRPQVRDLLFASLESHLAPAVFEPRSDWPTGEAGWFEAIRLAMRQRNAETPPRARPTPPER